MPAKRRSLTAEARDVMMVGSRLEIVVMAVSSRPHQLGELAFVLEPVGTVMVFNLRPCASFRSAGVRSRRLSAVLRNWGSYRCLWLSSLAAAENI